MKIDFYMIKSKSMLDDKVYVGQTSNINSRMSHHKCLSNKMLCNPLYDYILIADEGWMIYKNEHLEEYKRELPVKGMHGYFTDNMNMHAIFYAYGPLFKNNMKISTFELIHIYPMLCKLLNINPYQDIDGKLNVLQPILK